jgi:RNA polymerase sigma factor (sigma-70 family)
VLAQDLLQDVFVALWENWEKVDAERVANWLFVVSYNRSVTCLKKRLREQAGTIPDVNFPEELLQDHTVDEDLYSFKLSLLEEAIEKLPARKKQVFRLCRLEGRTADEAAEILGISAVSVKDYLKQATRSIKNYVSHYYPNAEAAGFILLTIFLSA